MFGIGATVTSNLIFNNYPKEVFATTLNEKVLISVNLIYKLLPSKDTIESSFIPIGRGELEFDSRLMLVIGQFY